MPGAVRPVFRMMLTTPPMFWLPYTTEEGPRTISMRSTSAVDSLEMLAVPARWPLIRTRIWLRKSRPWPSVAPPRMLSEVWPGVHSLMKPTAFSANSSVTDFAVDLAILSWSITCTVPATRASGSGRPVAVTTISGIG
jgi:hypothetical protein